METLKTAVVAMAMINGEKVLKPVDTGIGNDLLLGGMGEEIVGAIDIIDGDVDIVGAVVRAAAQYPANSKLQNMAAQAIAMKKAAYGHVVEERAAGRSRLYPLGFDSGAVLIAAAAAAAVVSQVQVPFRPDRLVVAATVAPNFLINGIQIGQANQFVAAVAVPAETFSQMAFDVSMHFDTAQTSQNITINVTNFSLAASRFLATMIGPAVLPGSTSPLGG